MNLLGLTPRSTPVINAHGGVMFRLSEKQISCTKAADCNGSVSNT